MFFKWTRFIPSLCLKLAQTRRTVLVFEHFCGINPSDRKNTHYWYSHSNSVRHQCQFLSIANGSKNNNPSIAYQHSGLCHRNRKWKVIPSTQFTGTTEIFFSFYMGEKRHQVAHHAM